MSDIARYLERKGLSPEQAAAYAVMDDATSGAERRFKNTEAPVPASVWGNVSVRLFLPGASPPRPEVQAVLVSCLDFVRTQHRLGALFDHTREGKLFSRKLLDGLRERGFFGLPISREYGGTGATMQELRPFLSALCLLHPDLSVLLEVHAILGPVPPLELYGSKAQKGRLRDLASGQVLGSFALTEADAGGDPGRLTTTARLVGDHYLLNGNKCFITNFTNVHGRATSVVVCRLEGHDLPQKRNYGMLIVDIPEQLPRSMRIVENDLDAFEALYNARVLFRDHPVPKENLLGIPGDGLVQAFASLGVGRAGICANCCGKLQLGLGEVIGTAARAKWVRSRYTFGQPLYTKPSVQCYVGEMAMNVVVIEALGDWVAGLATAGIRDEAAGYLAKVLASEALFEATGYTFRLQGGRSAVKGNFLSGKQTENRIPVTYEGPNNILTDVGGPAALVRPHKAVLEAAMKAMEPRFPDERDEVYAERTKDKWSKLWEAGKFFLKVALLPTQSRIDVGGLSSQQRYYVRRALARNRWIGCRYGWLMVRHGLAFTEQTLQTGELFRNLSFSIAALVTAIAVRGRGPSYQRIAEAAHLRAECEFRGLKPTLKLKTLWAQIGIEIATPGSVLFNDMIEGLELTPTSLDPATFEASFPDE